MRTGQDLSAIGKVADLVPTAAVMTVGDTGKIGQRGFRVGGRLQLDHGRGPWDEWYVAFDDGHWAWVAQAQGDYYITFPVEGADLPAWDALSPEDTVELSVTGNTALTVTQRGESRLLSAEGELPFAAVPGARGRFVDLEGPAGQFATIDYGDGSEPPKLFAGERLARNSLSLTQQALGPRPEQIVEADRLRCPTCGAPVPIRAPEITERVACSHCGALLDYDAGQLAHLRQLEQGRVEPDIPLGSEGVLLDQKATVIGFMRRFTVVSGVTYTWAEYLLYTDAGYRWLLEDQGHFTYLEPIPAPKVIRDGGHARYRGRRYRAFQTGSAEVGVVVGEFYWRVETGDRARTEDFVAPPHILSCERTKSEVHWSHGHYIDGQTIWDAFKLPGKPRPARGIAPCQPNPVSLLVSSAVTCVLLVALAVGALAIARGKREAALIEQALQVPQTRASNRIRQAGAPASITQTDPFSIDHGPTTLELELLTNVSNAWLGVNAALVNEETGEVREFYMMTEEWHGRSGGSTWSEGDPTQKDYLGSVPSGRYSLRLQPEWGSTLSSVNAPQAVLRARPGKRSSVCCLGSGVLLLLPLFWVIVRRAMFEARRWQHSDFAAAWKDHDW